MKMKRQIFKKTLIAFLAMLFLAAAAVALLHFLSAKAEEKLYPACTAEYEIDEEQNGFYWDGSYWRAHSTQGSEKKMVLHIKTAGTFVIGWGTNRSYNNKENGNTPMLYAYKYTDSSQKGQALFSVQGNGSTSRSDAMECRIEHVDVGEYVEIVFIEGMSDGNSYALLWMNAPTNTVNLSASVATDSIGKGHIKSDYSIEHSGEEVESDDYTIQWTAPFSVTAVAGEGNYFAYWTNAAGEILTRSETYTVKNVLAKNGGDHYYAHFVSSDYSAMQSSEKEDKPFWSSTDGKWSFDFSNYSPADKDVASLTYDFVAEEGQFVSFDYFQSCNAFTAISQKSSYPIFRLYLNGTELKKFVPYNATHEETDAIGNFAVPVTKTGYNQLEFRFYVTYAYRDLWKYEEGDQLYVDNIKVCGEEEVQTTQFVFNFESEWLKVTCTDVAKKETKEISSGVPVSLENGKMWQISSSAKNSTKPSEFDSSIKVNYSRTGVWTSKVGEILPYFVPQGNVLAMKGSDFSSSNSKVQTLRLDKSTEIETGYKEEVPLAVSATKTTDGEDTMINIPRGTTIDFPFGKENTMVVRIDTYNHFQAENYAITLDGEAYSGRVEAMDEFLAFVLTDVKNHIVSIQYNLPDDGRYIYSKTFVDFMVKEGVEGGIENIVKTPDSLNVEDTKDWGGQDTWLFDPELSEEGNYVYQASNSFLWIDESVSPGTDGLSTLAFSIKDTVAEETGSISFEFQISGSYYTDGNQQLLGAYLCYKAGEAVNKSVFGDMMEGQAKPKDLNDLARSIAGGKIITGNGVVKAGDWYRANIMIHKGETLYVSFFSYNVKPYGDKIDTYLNIRNIRLNVGNADVTVNRGANAQGTVTSAVGEQRNENQTGAVSYNVAIGSTLELSVSLGAEEVFYGWSVNGALVSTDSTVSLFVEGKMDVVAWMAPANFYVARAEGQFFTTIEDAVESAQSGTVYVIQDTTINRNFKIPRGVTLLIPYNDANGFMEAGKSGTADNKISWLNPTYKDAYRTVTVKADVTITVEGTLRVGAVVNYLVGQGYQGHTSGAYSELILEKGSKIQVASGGIMDVYGRVWGGEGKTGTDMGIIDVAEGGKLYQPFLILDYAGGTNALGAFMDGTTPFKRYAMINIECPITINYGGMLYGHASLWVETMTLHASLDQPFISNEQGDGNGHDTFIMLRTGASVTITYNPKKVVNNATAANGTEGIGQTTMIFNGGAKFSYMLFSAMGISVPTSPVMFSIPYNYNIELNGDKAQYETVTDFMIMPGATVKVGEGATLTLNANTWVFDGFAGGPQAGKQYPSASDLKDGGYSQSGNLIVDGTLKVGKKSPIKVSITIALESDEDEPVPAIFLGTIQTSSTTGKIEIPAETVLSGKVWAGLKNADYFAYTTTARVWDAAHNCFGNLEAGHTYTATSGAEFELTELNYTTTEGGQETTKLDLNQTMHGSWMIVHAQHQYDWTLKEDEQNFGSEKTKDITRECTELGCTQKETRMLIKVETGLKIGDLVYDGENVTAEELVALFKKYYGEKVNGFNFSAEFIAQKNHGDWDVTITIGTDNVYFYTTGNTADLKEFTFKYTITPAEIDGLELNADRAYNGTKLSNDEVIKAVKSGSLTLSTNDYDVEIINNSADAGEYTVKVTGKNNFEGEQQATYTIKAVDITIKVNSGTATYAGKKTAPEINATHAQTGEFVGGDGFKSVTVVVKEVPGEWSAKTYELTVKYELNETTNKGNYKITVDDAGAILTVNKAQVTLTVKGKNASYNSKGGYDVAWELDGIDGFLGEYEAEEALKMLTITCDVNTNNTVGNHDINAVLNAEYAWSGVAGELENFTVTCKGGTYNISPVGYGNLSFGGEKSVTYDGKDHELTLTVDDESVTVTIYYKLNTAADGDYKQDKPVNVGTYNVKAVLQSENYNDGDEFTFTTGGELVINPATIDGLTLTATSKKYDKQAIVPAELVESVTAGSLTLQKGDYDVKVDKDTVTVGDYTITVTGKGNYTGQKTATYKIEKKDITVTVYDQEKDYDNNSATLTQSGENVLKIADLCPGDALGITLGLGTNASKKDKGDYPIIPAIGGTVVANNYNITFKNGTGGTFTLTDETHVNYPMYHIKAIKATVTIDDVTDKIYGDEVVTTFTHKASGFIPGDSYTPTINYTCTLEEKPAANETGYDITGEVTNPNGNYEIEVKPGKYIIKQRPITVTINDQSSDYKHDHSYTFNANDWTTEDELAYDDDNAALQITLNHGELTDAGAYDITGSCANTNYKVTFKGSKEETKGVYTVNKLDISAEAIFWLTSEQGKDWTQDNDGYRVKYTGTPLSFTGHATYTQGDDDIELQVTINPETVQGEGETSVTMTISDKNYTGSKTVTLVVTDADGYTARLREALASLEGLAEGMDSEAFKEEDFGKLKQMQQIISTLDEKEREVAQSAIEGYEQLIYDWNSLADADSIIVAAETIADAPINGLFEAAAVTMALISLAYIAIKGGLL